MLFERARPLHSHNLQLTHPSGRRRERTNQYVKSFDDVCQYVRACSEMEEVASRHIEKARGELIALLEQRSP